MGTIVRPLKWYLLYQIKENLTIFLLIVTFYLYEYFHKKLFKVDYKNDISSAGHMTKCIAVQNT